MARKRRSADQSAVAEKPSANQSAVAENPPWRKRFHQVEHADSKPPIETADRQPAKKEVKKNVGGAGEEKMTEAQKNKAELLVLSTKEKQKAKA